MPDSRLKRYKRGVKYLAFCRSFKGRSLTARKAWCAQHYPNVPFANMNDDAALPLYGSFNKCIGAKSLGWVVLSVADRFPQPCTWYQWLWGRFAT